MYSVCVIIYANKDYYYYYYYYSASLVKKNQHKKYLLYNITILNINKHNRSRYPAVLIGGMVWHVFDFVYLKLRSG